MKEMTGAEIRALLDNSIVSVKVIGEVQCHWINPPVSQEEATQRERFKIQLDAGIREAFFEINKDVREMLEEL